MARVARALKVKDGSSRPFALLGCDVMLSAELVPWLCEINANPTLEAKRPIDRGVDLEMMTDLMQQLEGAEAPRWVPLKPEESDLRSISISPCLSAAAVQTAAMVQKKVHEFPKQRL